MTTDSSTTGPGHIAQVFAAEDFFVSNGANQGDGIMGPEEVCVGDVYVLHGQAEPLALALTRPEAGRQEVAPGSGIGRAGQGVRLVARYTLMAPDGDRIEVLLIDLGTEAAILPLTPIGTGVEYTLLAAEEPPEDLALADLLCLSFARGTMITLTDGSQRAIEQIVPGLQVLTRDHGRQTVRWIGQAHLRAVGATAPVVITKGKLGNDGDLVVSQHHRVFLYQRERVAGMMTSELLVPARDLIDGDTVYLREGGYVDYFSLVFDRHEIIYAEGVPCESLLVNEATVSRLPPEIAAEMKARFPGLTQTPHFGSEAGRDFLEAVGRVPKRRA
ncbi:Hint domain-containing protein [Rhodobacter sp. KR11]|uniref:Hint domain-containing protein n=1 Tax=Rhodobacter sp. KR11 TaxID=2974588 RepID=UPI0022213CD6|nr:Hint domain-containing protein [Rhodobacter sp. KR11]MCW1917665.1 Hint domain-containing protein [Rhodobacter sp. KR11]